MYTYIYIFFFFFFFFSLYIILTFFLGQGLTFSESWSTGGDLNAELKYQPSSVEGLELSLSSNWTPFSGYE